MIIQIMNTLTKITHQNAISKLFSIKSYAVFTYRVQNPKVCEGPSKRLGMKERIKWLKGLG
jgi:hypothetical protein